MTTPREKWIEALRSGKYRQGMGYLRTKTDSYCCLGVACDLYQQEVGGLDLREEEDVYSYDGVSDVLPEKVLEWIGLRCHTGGACSRESLVTLNDDGVHTFEEIADILEKDKGEYFELRPRGECLPLSPKDGVDIVEGVLQCDAAEDEASQL